MKMVDIWLIFCLVVPFLEVILRTAIKCANCSCNICKPEEPKVSKEEEEGKDDEGKGADLDLVQGGLSSGAWTLTGAKLAAEQVKSVKRFKLLPSQVSTSVQDKPSKSKGELVVARRSCWTATCQRALKTTGLWLASTI